MQFVLAKVGHWGTRLKGTSFSMLFVQVYLLVILQVWGRGHKSERHFMSCGTCASISFGDVEGEAGGRGHDFKRQLIYHGLCASISFGNLCIHVCYGMILWYDSNIQTTGSGRGLVEQGGRCNSWEIWCCWAARGMHCESDAVRVRTDCFVMFASLCTFSFSCGAPVWTWCSVVVSSISRS